MCKEKSCAMVEILGGLKYVGVHNIAIKLCPASGFQWTPTEDVVHGLRCFTIGTLSCGGKSPVSSLVYFYSWFI